MRIIIIGLRLLTFVKLGQFDWYHPWKMLSGRRCDFWGLWSLLNSFVRRLIELIEEIDF
jgi:hypothetical protein